MSVQLIVYPQSPPVVTPGATTYTWGSTNYIVDGQNFNSINSSNLEDDNTVGFNPGFTFYPSNLLIPNTWFRFRNAASLAAQPTAPAQIGNKLYIYNEDYTTGNKPYGGVYQRFTNLTWQKEYTIKINFTPHPTQHFGRLHLQLFQPSGATGSQWVPKCWSANLTCAEAWWDTTSISYTFNSNYDDEFILRLYYVDNFNPYTNPIQPIVINDISINERFSTTTGSTVTGAKQEILDLYEDESIPLTLSVDDFKDVASKTQSYSKAFNLPATKKNNKVFGSLYEVTKQAGTGTFGFNPYARTSVTLKENGFIVFEGFLRLIDIIDKDGEISYNVNLYSETVAFMDVLKDKTFYELNLCELDHDYNLDSIQASQTGVLPLTNALQADSFAGATGATTTDVLKYPLVDWAGSMRREATTKETNLGATDGNPSMSRLEDGFRPFIKLKYLVDNIFADAGFTYSSALFDSAYFSNLFMDFNWGEERDGSAPNRNDFCRRQSDLSSYWIQSGAWTNIPVNEPSTWGTPPGGSTALWNNTGYYLQSDVNNLTVTSGYYHIQVESVATVSKYEVQLRICVFNSSNSVIETIAHEIYKDSTGVGPGTSVAISGNFETVLNNGDYIQMEAICFVSNKIRMSQTNRSHLDIIYNNNAVGVCSLLQAARGELAQWDFFKGLTTMFNLITLQDPQDPSNLLIEPYDDIFTANPDIKTLDWTQKVDVSDIKLKPLDLERRVVFQFEEDEDDYPFMQYKTATAGYLYGSGIVAISGFELFQGDKEVVASPFAATIFKPLFDDIFDFYAPVIYGSNEDQTEFGPIKNLPRILYDTGVYTISTTTFYIPAQNGSADSNEASYSLFSHTDVVPSASTDVDLSFSVVPYQLMIQSAVAPLQNLFTNYYFNYFSELYNTDAKTMNIKVWLTPEDISNFNFYDRILIKNRDYRVDKINYKPNDLSTVEFILIT